MRRLGLTSVALGLALLLPARIAKAQTEPISAKLEWQAPPTGSNCIDQPALKDAVEQRLGRRVFSPNEPDVVVHGGVARDGSHWLVSIKLSAAHGEAMGHRELESEGADCSTLDDSLALVLAVMLDISKARVPPAPAKAPKAPIESQPEAQGGEPAGPKPTSSELTSRLHVPPDTPARRPRWHFEVGLGATAALGLLPAASFGAHGYVAVSPPNFWRVALGVESYRSVSETVDGTGAGASFAPLAATLSICPLAQRPLSWGFEACLLQHFGRMQVEAYGFDENEELRRSYVNLGISGAASLALAGPLFAKAGAALETPLLRETFRYGTPGGGEPSLFRMATLLAAAQLGLGASF